MAVATRHQYHYVDLVIFYHDIYHHLCWASHVYCCHCRSGQVLAALLVQRWREEHARRFALPQWQSPGCHLRADDAVILGAGTDSIYGLQV